MANEKLRTIAREKGVFLWQIAEMLGISEPTMTRLLRTELSEDKRARIMAAINELSHEGASA